MTVSAIIARRKAALLRDFATHDVPPLLAVEDRAQLGRMTFLEEFEEDEAEARLGRRRPGSVIIRQGAGNPDSAATLWVASDYRGYRSAYKAFLRTVYDVPVSTADLAPYDVDHLLNRARSAAGTSVLRIEAIPSKANQTWGAAFERWASNEKIAKNRSDRRLMSYLIAAKVMGLAPPAGPKDRAGIRAIGMAMGPLGLDPAEVEAGVANMLTHVWRNR